MGIIENINELLMPFYTRISVAIFLVIFGLILGKILGRVVKKVLAEIKLDKLIKSMTGISFRMESIFSSIVTYFIYFIFVIWALEKVGLGSIVLNILAGGVVIIVIISLLLGIKDFLPNAVAGLFLNIKGIVNEDDWIKSDNIEGKVIKVELIDTILETKKKDIIFIPNSVLVRSKIIKLKKKN